MSRMLATPDLITVQATEDGVPVSFRWRNQYYLVITISKRARVDTGLGAKRIWEEYFNVETNEQYLLKLSHDLIRDTWYVQRILY